MRRLDITDEPLRAYRNFDPGADDLRELPLVPPWLARALVGESNLALERMSTSETVSEDIGRLVEEPDAAEWR